MKILLRSTFVARPEDDASLIYRNVQALQDSGLGFEVMEDNVIWRYIQEFVSQHHHVPDITSIRGHFKHLREDEIVDRLEALEVIPLRVRGNFLTHLGEKVEDHRTRSVVEILKDAARVVETGITIKEGKEETILKGPQHAIRYVLDRGHDIIMPPTGVRLSGDVAADGENFKAEYDRVESDPLAGIGQFCGITQIDERVRGAKRAELWTHAAFTGGLKCIAGDTQIFDLSTGKLSTALELYRTQQGPLIHALNKSWQLVEAQATPLVESGVRTIYKVETDKGRTIRVSGNHPFKTVDGWKNADSLTDSDWVAVASELPSRRQSPFTDEEVRALGYLLGDGGLIDDITFTNSSKEMQEDFKRCLRSMGMREARGSQRANFPAFRVIAERPCKSDKRKTIRIIRASRSTGQKTAWVSPIRLLLDRLGLYGCGSEEKHIPGDLWQMEDRQAWSFLSALWATDGRIGTERGLKNRSKRPKVWYGSKSEALVRGVHLFLQRLGVPSSVSFVPRPIKGAQYPFWVVQVLEEGCGFFLQQIQPIGKKCAVAKALGQVKDKSKYKGGRFPPALFSEIPDEFRVPTRNGWYYARYAKKRNWLSGWVASRFAKAFQSDQLQAIVGSKDVRWEQIRNVTTDGEEMTYDLSVPGPANFVAEGFITHNSTFMFNWAYNQSVYYRHSSAVFSLEMPYQQVRRFLFALHSYHEKFEAVRVKFGIKRCLLYQRIRDGELDHYSDDEITHMKPAERKILLEDASGVKRVNPLRPEKRFLFEHVIPDFEDPKNEYGSLHIEVADPDKSDFTVADLRRQAEVLYHKDPDIRAIFVDHMGLMAPRKWNNSTTERLNEVLRDLKKMAMNFNRGMGIAVVGLFQISREGFKSAAKNDGRYNLTHLSYANEAERSSDIVTASFVDDDLRARSLVRFQCLKSRDDQPFDVFLAGVLWACRRIFTTHDVTAEDAQKAGQEIDDLLG